MMFFRRKSPKAEPPDQSSVAVVVDPSKYRSEKEVDSHNDVPPPRSRSRRSSDDWAAAGASLGIPRGVTDDRSEDGSPRVVYADGALPSSDKGSGARPAQGPQQPSSSAPYAPPLSRQSTKDGLLLRYGGGAAAANHISPHSGPTPRSGNHQSTEVSAYFFMDHNDDPSSMKRVEETTEGAGEGDGLFWQGPQSWWKVIQNRLAPASQEPPAKALILTAQDNGGDWDEQDPADVDLLTRFGLFLCSNAIVYIIVFVGMVAGLAYGTVNQLKFFSNIDWDQEVTVAFVGTSYLFVNDIPRLLEAISAGQVIQDSCLRSGGSLATVLLYGNGMYYRWQTNEAIISPGAQDDYYATFDDDAMNNSHLLYDFGACSVHQLLVGYDSYLRYGNGNKAYLDDGNNPCLVDENYYRYIGNKYVNAPQWDFVVLADQSKRMAASSSSARYDSIDALVSVYAPLLRQSGAIPLIVDTHAFWSSQTNMTGLRDVPTFASRIYLGLSEYIEALTEELPSNQAPVVVPIGLAYLLVWEENYNLWEKLFLSDEMHSSMTGSYLFACVLYTKMFGHLPKRTVSIPRRMEYLFAFSRKTIGPDAIYPSQSEAEYLRGIAKRIVLDGYIPKSFNATAISNANDDGDGEY